MTPTTTTTPRRMTLPNALKEKEGDRIQVPEGGELVCYRTDNGLALKVVYSREMMVKFSASIFCHQRPSGFAKIAEETPELLGLPSPIPLTSALPLPPLDSSPPVQSSPVPTLHHHHCVQSSAAVSPLHVYSPLRGPVTMATESMKLLSIQREFKQRMLELESAVAAGGHDETLTFNSRNTTDI